MDYSKRDARWWLDRKGGEREPHEGAFAVLASMRERRRQRMQQGKLHASFYGQNLAAFGMPHDMTQTERLSFNAAENAIDTVVSKTTKSRILPMAVTSGATAAQRQRAKGFNRFIQGLFTECRVWDDLDPLFVLDALLFEAGVAKVMEENGKVVVDRVFPWDVSVDDFEARSGNPRNWYQDHIIDRLVLEEQFKGDAEAVKAIEAVVYSREDEEFVAVNRMASDMIVVHEAWHLPSGPKAKDGRHIVFIQGYTLVDEPYTRSKAPFLILHRKKPVAGIWGHALMASLAPGQREFDKLNEKIQSCHDLMGVPRLLVPRNANLKKSEFDDIEGGIIEFDGPQPPTEWNAMPIHADVYTHRQSVASDMLQYSGISEMSARGELPQGITAARAIQMVEDTESERLGPFWRCREAFYCQMAEMMLEVAREIAKDSNGYVVQSVERRQLYPVKLEDVDIAQDAYKIQIFPTSLLSKSPAARYDLLTDMRARGDVDETEFRQLLDMPDLDAENDMETATVDIIDQNIDAILSKGMSMVAEPFDDWKLIVERGAKAYNLARLQRPDEEGEVRDHESRLRLLSQYIVSAQNYMTTQQAALAPVAPAAAPPAPTPPGGAIGPYAMPGATPPMTPPQ